MRVVMEYETAQGRRVYDVHEKNLGYDATSLDLQSGELRLVEVKGLAAATGSILLTPNERRVADDRLDCYWLYMVTDCATELRLREPIKDPARFPWHEVIKVAHYRLHLKNWKSFQDVDFAMADRMFLVGPNASGKSKSVGRFPVPARQ